MTSTWVDVAVVVGVCLILGVTGDSGATVAEWIMGIAIVIAFIAWAKNKFAMPGSNITFTDW